MNLSVIDNISIPTVLGLRFVNKVKIVFFEFVAKETDIRPCWMVHLNDNSIIKLRQSICAKQINEMINDDRFIKLNACTIINLMYVDSIEYKSRTCNLKPNIQRRSIRVSRSHLKLLKDKFDNM